MVHSVANSSTDDARLPVLDEKSRSLLASALANAVGASAVQQLLNPTPLPAGAVTATMETARSGPPRYDLFISTTGAPAFAFSAFRHRTDERDGFHYAVRLAPTESSTVSARSA